MSKTNSRSRKNLRTELKRLGLSQAEFSRLFHVSPATVHNWVSGKTSTPSWVIPALTIYGLLPEISREDLLGIRRLTPLAAPRESKTHPFARIDEL